MTEFFYTANELMASTKPYEDLYAIKDPFTQTATLNELKAWAKEKFNFQGVQKMWKAYLESQKQAAGIVTVGNATFFTGQPLELSSGEWEADDSGIWRQTSKGVEWACPHPIMPIERLINIDTGEEKLRLAFKKGTFWRKIIVGKNVLANANKVIDLASVGIAVNSQTSRNFVQYVTDIETLNYAQIPEVLSVGRLGFIADQGFSPYVDSLVFDGDAAYATMFNAVKQHGKYESWKAVAREARGMSVTAQILLASSFASVLLKGLGTLPFFVHLWGVDSGTGKTVALMVAASVWADPTVGTYVKTFDSTAVGQEKTAAFLNNLPLCIDELQLAKDSKGRTQFDVYKLAQGVGRTRGNRNGGVDATPHWCNCILTTGESPLTGTTAGAGAVNRVIDIECKASQVVVKDGVRLSRAVKENYGFAGKDFVEHIMQPGVAERIQSRQAELFKQLSEMDTTEKQAHAAATILVADELMCEWIFDGQEKPLTVSEIAEFLASKAAVSAGERGYKFLCDWVTTNSNKLCQRSDSASEIYGALKDDKAYIIRNVFEKAITNEGFSTAALLSYLKSNRLIWTKDKGYTRSIRINGVSTDCICLVLPATSDEDDDDMLPL